jgi:hypothetical protein
LKTVLLLGGSQLGSNFFSEVVDRLLDAFAYFEVSGKAVTSSWPKTSPCT